MNYTIRCSRWTMLSRRERSRHEPRVTIRYAPDDGGAKARQIHAAIADGRPCCCGSPLVLVSDKPIPTTTRSP